MLSGHTGLQFIPSHAAHEPQPAPVGLWVTWVLHTDLRDPVTGMKADPILDIRKIERFSVKGLSPCPEPLLKEVLASRSAMHDLKVQVYKALKARLAELRTPHAPAPALFG